MTNLTPSQAEAQENHGFTQAQAQTESIVAMVAALECDYERLQELRDQREDLSNDVEDADEQAEFLLKEACAALAKWDAENGEELAELEAAAGDCADEEEARETIQENALSVEVRSGWDVVGGDMSASEFRIVLCTGGPHVEIRGELDNYGQPSRAWMQYQDWGTPMTQVFGVEQSTLLTYCSQFYYGE